MGSVRFCCLKQQSPKSCSENWIWASGVRIGMWRNGWMVGEVFQLTFSAIFRNFSEFVLVATIYHSLSTS